MFNFANKPQHLAGIFFSSIRLYKASFGEVWRWQLLWLIPMVFLPASTGLNATGVLNVLTSHLNAPSFNALFTLYSIFVLLIIIYGETFLLSRIYHIGSHQELNTPTSLALAKNKFLPIVGGYALTWFIILALLVAAGLLFGLIYFLTSRVSGHAGSTLLLIMFTLTLMIGIFLVILMFFFNIFILFENVSTIQSIKKSINLVRGSWWRTFVAILVPVVVIFIVVQIVNFMMNLVMPRTGIASNIANLCVLTLLYPWFNSLILIQFNDLKLRQRRTPIARAANKGMDIPK